MKGQLIRELEYKNRPETIDELKIKLNKIHHKLRYIHILNNSASMVDEVIHLAEMRKEFCLEKQCDRQPSRA